MTDDRGDAARKAADAWAETRKATFPTLNPAQFDNERVFVIYGFLEGVSWLEQRETTRNGENKDG